MSLTPEQTGTERLCWAQGSPATLKAVSTVIRGQRVNLAAAICWENYMPLVRQALYEQNINLYLAPTADGRDAWLSLMRTIGVEGRCFVVSSNMAVRKAPATSSQASPTRSRARRSSTFTNEGFEIALPSTSPTRHKRRKSVFDEDGNEIVLGCDESNGNDQDGTSPGTQYRQPTTKADGWTSRGGSSVVTPFGDVVAGPQWEDDEGIIYADIDLRECIRGRLDLDTAGHYSRNDSFKFSVNELDLDPLPY
jgi:nitrilase